MTDSIQPIQAIQAEVPEIPVEVLTPEQIAQHYSALLDSVTLINEYRITSPTSMSEEEVADAIKRNIEHCNLMLAKPYWTNEDLSSVKLAVK